MKKQKAGEYFLKKFTKNKSNQQKEKISIAQV